MTPLIEKYFKKEVLSGIVKKHNFDKETYEEFIRYLDENLRDEEECADDWQEEDFDKHILKYGEKYAVLFLEKRKEGFSHAWSKQYARAMCYNDDYQLLGLCYDASKNADPDQAQNDLLLYCELRGADERFTKYFIESVEAGEIYFKPDSEERAKLYSETYKDLIKEGKTEIYAEKFAYLTALDEYHEIYIEDYAFAYEKSILEGKDESYAIEYADVYASELVDAKRRYGLCDDEEHLEYKKIKAHAYIKGWDYARNNIDFDRHKFIKIFERIFMNMYYSDNEKYWVGIEKIEKFAINLALEEYNRYIEIKGKMNNK